MVFFLVDLNACPVYQISAFVDIEYRAYNSYGKLLLSAFESILPLKINDYKAIFKMSIWIQKNSIVKKIHV